MSYFDLSNTIITTAAATGNSFGPSQSDALTVQQRNKNTPTQLLSSAWLKSTARWPDCLENVLRSQMLKHQFFNHRRTNGESCIKLQTIMGEPRKCFDPESWNASVHDCLLQERMLNKVTRIRVQLENRRDIMRYGSSYIPFATDLGSLENTTNSMTGTLASFDAIVSQLSPESCGQALRTLCDRIGHAEAIQMLRGWQDNKENPDFDVMIASLPHGEKTMDNQARHCEVLFNN